MAANSVGLRCLCEHNAILSLGIFCIHQSSRRPTLLHTLAFGALHSSPQPLATECNTFMELAICKAQASNSYCFPSKFCFFPCRFQSEEIPLVVRFQ